MLMCASVRSVHEHGDSGRSAALALPLAFNASFATPAARFDYPDILRRPTDELLERYRQGGTALVLVGWAFALTAVLFAPLVVLLPRAISDADGTLLAVGVTVGRRESVATPLGARALENRRWRRHGLAARPFSADLEVLA
jgi:hypothetical protein